MIVPRNDRDRRAMLKKVNTGMTAEDKALISVKLSDQFSVLCPSFHEGSIGVASAFGNKRNAVAARTALIEGLKNKISAFRGVVNIRAQRLGESDLMSCFRNPGDASWWRYRCRCQRLS